MERKMQSGKKSLSTFLFILLVSTLPSVANAAEIPWSPEAPLTTDSSTDRSPCVEQIIQGTNKTIWVVWHSNRNGNYDIYYKNSSDGGATWSDEKPIINYTGADKYPSITQTANGSIWVVWARYVNYQWDLYYTISSDGVNWSDKKTFTTDPNNDQNPSITQTTDGTIWVVWQSDRVWVNQTIPQDDIFYKNSSDGGATWSSYTQLTTDPGDDVTPSITQTADDKIWVTWSSDRYDCRDIFYKTSSDGTTWSDEFQLTEHSGDDGASSITQTTDGTIWVVWHSVREENDDIYYRTSDDGGASWSNDMRLTEDAGADITPSVTQTADDTIWIVWASNRAGNYDIWYATKIVTVGPDIAITAVEPDSTAVFRGETVSIEVAIVNEGNTSETFNITVYADEDDAVIGDEITIGTQTATNLVPQNNATLTFNWETKNVSLGNYAISAYAWPVQDEIDLADNLLTNGVIQIRKLLGDLDYDADVDVDDHVLFLGSYGSSIGDPHYNPDADLDGDGNVDDYDYYVFLSFCGRSGLSADVTRDGEVDADDFGYFVGTCGSSIENRDYYWPNADLDCDGDVDDYDRLLFLPCFYECI